ncbi:MAG TPA: hypothetical protein VF944_08765 [Candidatus Bathyarchaeia archaeon]
MRDERRLYTAYFAAYMFIAIGIYLLRQRPNQPLQPWVLAASAASAFAPAYVFAVMVNRYLWRVVLIRKLLGITTPCVHGRWVGYIKSSYSSYATEHRVTIEFWQTLRDLHVWYYDDNAITSSLVAGFSPSNEGGPTRLYCVYHNQPFRTTDPNLQSHNGVMEMIVEPSGRRIIGIYYNNPHQRKTYGEMRLEREGKRLLGRLESPEGSK